MILSRGKTFSANSNKSEVDTVKRSPTLADFILERDYTGAKSFIDILNEEENSANSYKEWIAFCNFHLAEYENALEHYKLLDVEDTSSESNKLNIAVTMFYLGMYDEAQAILPDIPSTPEKIRLMFHLAHKLNNEEHLMELHESLQDIIEDQLCLASLHYLRAHYQEAIDIYKKISLDNKHFLALNVYLALCFYKLDYFDMSQEVLDIYLNKHPNSTIAINLKACNKFRLYNGRVAEQEIRNIVDNGTFGLDLVKHNLVVFANGEGALQTFSTLLNVIPEARLNLAIFHLKHGDINESYNLMKEVQPNAPHEYILKGLVHAALGQQIGSKEHIKTAQQNLHLIGSSESECDTIPGRQSMASAFFLYGQFEEVLVYLSSIRSYFINDDTFNYNYAQAKAATGSWKEATDLFNQISDSSIRAQYTYLMLLARCYIYSGNSEKAWNIYTGRDTNTEAFLLLQLIANDCYKCEEFWVAAKAFDMLEKLDASPENWEGKRGACAGALYAVLSKKKKGSPPNGISDIISILRNSSNSQAEGMLKSIRKYVQNSN